MESGSIAVGVWTDGINQQPIKGPYVAEKRMLNAFSKIDPTDIKITCLHHQQTEDEIYNLFDSKQVEDGLGGKISFARNQSYDYTLNVDIPSNPWAALREVDVNQHHNRIIWVQGLRPFIPQAGYSDELVPGQFSDRLINRLSKTITRMMIRNYDYYVANSYFTRDLMVDFLNLNEDNIFVIYNGVDKSVFKDYSRDELRGVRKELGITPPVIAYVAGYAKYMGTPRKGPMTVVRALEELRDRSFDPHLVVAGYGYQGSMVEKYVEKNGLQAAVTFSGHLDEITLAKLYNLSSVFLFPSLYETFGMVLIEAMAAGCPVVTSNCTAIPEVVGGAAELLQDPTDHIEAADAVETVLSSEQLQSQMAQQGRERARQFTWDRCAADFLQLFREIDTE